MGNKHTSMKLGFLALVITFALAVTMVLIGTRIRHRRRRRRHVRNRGHMVGDGYHSGWTAAVSVAPHLCSWWSPSRLLTGGIAPALGNVYQGTSTRRVPTHAFASRFWDFSLMPKAS